MRSEVTLGELRRILRDAITDAGGADVVVGDIRPTTMGRWDVTIVQGPATVDAYRSAVAAKEWTQRDYLLISDDS